MKQNEFPQECASGRCSGCKTGHSGRTEAHFDTWKLRNASASEGFALRPILTCASHEQCVLKLAGDLACGQVVTSLFSQV